MSNLQHSNIQELIEQWYQQEKDGVQFPVDFFLLTQSIAYCIEISRQGDFITAFALLRKIKKIRRQIALPSDSHHDILINLLDAADISIYHDSQPCQKRERDGFVYFAVSSLKRMCKIGFTINLYDRINTLETQSGEKLILVGYKEGNQQLETKYHQKFKHLRSIGEWFVLNKELKSFLWKEFTATRLILSKLPLYPSK